MQPLRIEAKWLSPEPSARRSGTSGPDIAALLEVLDEPLRDGSRPASTPAQPALPASGQRSVSRAGNAAAELPGVKPPAAPAATRRSNPLVKGLITTLVGIALVPLALLFVVLWQDMTRPRGAHEPAPAEQTRCASIHDQSGSAQLKQAASPLEVALSSPDRIAADAGEVIEFPIAIDATEALPVRSIIAVTAMPQGAAFSAGRPFGDNGWSLRPDEIGELQLRLAAESGNCPSDDCVRRVEKLSRPDERITAELAPGEGARQLTLTRHDDRQKRVVARVVDRLPTDAERQLLRIAELAQRLARSPR